MGKKGRSPAEDYAIDELSSLVGSDESDWPENKADDANKEKESDDEVSK